MHFSLYKLCVFTNVTNVLYIKTKLLSPSHECFAKKFKIPSMSLSLRRFAKSNRKRFGGHLRTVHALRYNY